MSAPPNPAITHANLNWLENDIPFSIKHDDIYYSRASGQEEANHVFIAGNNLVERFQALPSGGQFTIAETGFGSGLNFLVTWELWQKYAPGDATLSFLSVEKFPLRKTDLARSHLPWTTLADKSLALQAQYPEPVSGVHRSVFNCARKNQPGSNGKISLTLFLGDAEQWLQACSFHADAWFLDGFSPKHNPEMWSATLFKGIRQHSRKGTTLATFTTAGFIRQALTEQGFTTTKTLGFANKREMTRAVLNSATNIKLKTDGSTADKILIVGAGLAGAMTARALAHRGYQVEVLDAARQPAQGASGNPQGALYVKLAVDWSPHTRYHLASYLYAINTYRAWLQPELKAWNPTGLLLFAHNDREALRQRKFNERSNYPPGILFPASQQEAEQLTGVALKTGGLVFPGGGWCRPAIICEEMLKHPLITLHPGTSVVRQSQQQNAVILHDRQGKRYAGDYVVYCTGPSLAVEGALPASIPGLPVKPIKGQVSMITLPLEQRFPLKAVICGNGYAMPMLETNGSRHLVTGASFHLNTNNLQVSREDDLENMARFREISTSFKTLDDETTGKITGRASVRGALPDYFPAVGLLQPHTYVSLGYGSKGLALTPLAGEIVADMISQTPLPLEDDLIRRLSPDRFRKS